MANCRQESQVFLFAQDIALISKSNDTQEDDAYWENEMVSSNHLLSNEIKTKWIKFSKFKTHNSQVACPSNVFENTFTSKYLGLILENQLDFNLHIEGLKTRIELL